MGASVDGLFVSLVLGTIFAPLFQWGYVRIQRRHAPDIEYRFIDVSAVIVGLLERLFFTLAVAYEVSGAVIAMIAWLTVKLLTHRNSPLWNTRGLENEERKALMYGAYAALIAGFVSMSFALVGGLVWAGKSPIPDWLLLSHWLMQFTSE